MWLTVKELSEIFKFKKSTVYLWVERGVIPHYKIGRLVRFKSEEVEEWLANFKNTSSTPHKGAHRHVSGKTAIDIVRKAIDATKGLKV